MIDVESIVVVRLVAEVMKLVAVVRIVCVPAGADTVIVKLETTGTVRVSLSTLVRVEGLRSVEVTCETDVVVT